MANLLLVNEETSRYPQQKFRKVESPHDKLFKETFSHIKVTRSFLHHYLPPGIMKFLNTDTLKLEKDSFISKELEESYSDLLFSADIDGKEGYVYFLFEHKSYADRTVTFQILKYMAEFWDAKMRKENLKTVPPVIPLVMYHGNTSWNTPDRLSKAIANYDDLPREIRQFIPNYKFLLFDFTNYPDEEIKGEARIRILITMFRDIRKAETVQELLSILERSISYLQELDDKQTGMEYFETMLYYIFSTATNVTRGNTDEITEKIKNHYPEGSRVIMSLADMFREEGKELGKKLGKEEGKKIGKKQGIEEGKKRGKKEMEEMLVKNAIKKGLDLRIIEEITGLSQEEIQKIASKLKK
ncbi:Rpn family recombination-promoting nuclease/putative transposase [Oceanobacillus sp. AG]|uniref:Rpn family recombination-promoting nuclease/putative transposase n=1 Tax=Oceanobacillus sp. AG TaxID=2681969 RepID=UPI0018DEA9C0|nr:Rpn family recombination-promoting nuclease/putative transposase [Oceanobacillus sp. AG]